MIRISGRRHSSADIRYLLSCDVPPPLVICLLSIPMPYPWARYYWSYSICLIKPLHGRLRVVGVWPHDLEIPSTEQAELRNCASIPELLWPQALQTYLQVKERNETLSSWTLCSFCGPHALGNGTLHAYQVAQRRRHLYWQTLNQANHNIV